MSNNTNYLHFNKPRPSRYHQIPRSSSCASEEVESTSEDYERLTNEVTRLSSTFSNMEKLSGMEIEDILAQINHLKQDVAILGGNSAQHNESLVNEVRDLKEQLHILQGSVECGSKIRKRMGVIESKLDQVRRELEDHLEGHSFADIQLKDSMKRVRGESAILNAHLCSYLKLFNYQTTVDVRNQSKKRRYFERILQILKMFAVYCWTCLPFTKVSNVGCRTSKVDGFDFFRIYSYS